MNAVKFIAISLLAIAGCEGSSPIAPFPKKIAVAPLDEEKADATKWLKENLDSGSWEEIKWWGPSSYKASDWTDEANDKICGIKIRTTNQHGAKAIQGYLFAINDHHVSVLLQQLNSPALIDGEIGPRFQDP